MTSTPTDTYRYGIGPLRPVERPPYTVEVPGVEAAEGETVPRRHIKAQDGLATRPEPDVTTVYTLLEASARKYANIRCVGSRQLVKTHRETKQVTITGPDGKPSTTEKEWLFPELGEYAFKTYAEYRTLTLELASGLRKVGLEPGDKFHMFGATSQSWLSISHACSSQSITIVTAYDTLGANGVEHTLVQTAPKAMFIDPHLFKVASGPLKRATSIKTLIYNDLSTNAPKYEQSDVDAFKQSRQDLHVMSYSELRELGTANPTDPVPPKPEDIYCIMYTSGTSGLPKGVETTHHSFIAAVAGLYGVVEEVIGEGEVILAYLPLAHIFEMVLENIVLYVGAILGYGGSRTLSDTGVRGCLGDLRALKPSVLVGVPQVWETVKKGIMSRLETSPAPIRALFWGAYAAKDFLVRNNLPGATAFDSIVFGKVRALTGGRLRFIVNGASGISADTQRFMSLVLAPMILGYGLTETGGNGALGSPLQFSFDSIGPLSTALEAKLVSIPELNYLVTNKPRAQGELLVRGAPVLKGYYNDSEETAKAITHDGWFRTGDIAEFDEVGHCRVIDRVKNLVKLQGGEYIALEKLEAIYRSSKFVQNLMVYGSAELQKPIAVIFVNEAAVKKEAKALGVAQGPEQLSNPKVENLVLRDFNAVGKAAGLSGMEMVSGVVLSDEEWTPANGLVTATQKINRRAIKEHYEGQIEKVIKGR